MIKVNELRLLPRANCGIPNVPGVYKWWCTKETLFYLLKQISAASITSGICLSNYENMIETQIEHKFFKEYDQELFCFYVGKADTNNGLRNRIISNHIKGNVTGSTLRKTIFSLMFGRFDRHNPFHNKNDKRGYVDQLLDSVFVEWKDYNQRDVHDNEIREINSYLRILNIDNGDLKDGDYSRPGFDVDFRRNIVNNVKFLRRNTVANI